ncbi:MAG: RluA family pseudouridine synthase [Acidobacteria bacterium]|nr:RluA family pseudouridine synthase [Acidobacteriota bacterium]
MASEEARAVAGSGTGDRAGWRRLAADRGDQGRRLDLVVHRHLRDLPSATRTQVQIWIRAGQVRVNGVPANRASARVALGDLIAVALPGGAARLAPAAEPGRLSILHEDEHLLAVDKPPGIVVHPTYRHPTGTLLNMLVWHLRECRAGQRPSIVGRLDKGTSGIVLVAKTAAMHAALQRAMASPTSRKDYLAVVYGRMTGGVGRISARLKLHADRRRMIVAPDGADAETCVERLADVPAPRPGLSVLRCRLVTGRRHQIRAHLAWRGWPIVGDPVYGAARWEAVQDPELAEALRTFPRQALHAWTLALVHPATARPLAIDAPIPEDLRTLLESSSPRILTC